MIEIYGFPHDVMNCPNCRNAVKMCELNGADYKFYPLIDGIFRGKLIRNKENTDELLRRLGQTDDNVSVPKIFVDGEFIGNLGDLREYFRRVM